MIIILLLLLFSLLLFRNFQLNQFFLPNECIVYSNNNINRASSNSNKLKREVIIIPIKIVGGWTFFLSYSVFLRVAPWSVSASFVLWLVFVMLSFIISASVLSAFVGHFRSMTAFVFEWDVCGTLRRRLYCLVFNGTNIIIFLFVSLWIASSWCFCEWYQCMVFFRSMTKDGLDVWTLFVLGIITLQQISIHEGFKRHNNDMYSHSILAPEFHE